MTATDGSYALKGLPGGRCRASASKTGFVTFAFGAKRSLDSGRPIEVSRGQPLEGIDFVLPRAGVVTGRVLDDVGDGVADVAVSVLRPSFLLGRLDLLPISGPSLPTDDRGEFRIWDLPPGSYYLVAVQETSRTYYPGTADAVFASRLQVRAGEETFANIRLLLDRPVQVIGRVLTSDGEAAAHATVRMLSPGQLLGGGWTVRTDEDGRFQLRARPGEYRVTARAADRRESATLFPSIGNSGLEGLVVPMEPSATVRGRVRADAGPLPPKLAIRPTRIPLEFVPEPEAAVPAGLDGTFEVFASAGRYLMVVDNLPPGWTVSKVAVGETVMTDNVLDVAAGQDVERLELHLSQDATEISGEVRAEEDEAVSSYAVVIFAEDRQRWPLFRRVMRHERPDQHGRFATSDLLPGKYLAVALPDVDVHEWADPEFLEKLVPLAASLTLSPGEKKSVTLTIKELR